MTSSVTSAAMTAGATLPSISSRDEQKIRAAKAAVESMTVRQDRASEERKAIAKKKAEELKARIQMLKMSMPANPEAVGKIIAQLARELGSIVKSYGGTGSDLGVASAATPAAGGEATASGAAPTVTASEGAEAPVDPEANPDASAAAPKDPYRAAMAAQAAASADQARKADGAREDSEFATTVKQLLAELKAMKTKAEADAKAAGDPNTPEVADADKALAAVDSALGDAGLSGSMVSLVV